MYEKRKEALMQYLDSEVHSMAIFAEFFSKCGLTLPRTRRGVK